MIEHKKLIDYLPPFLAEYREYKRLFAVVQAEDDSILQKVENSLNDTYIDLATADGIARWEKLLSITPTEQATLEERRIAIKLKFNKYLPYTMKVLRQMLDDLLGSGKYILTFNPPFSIYLGVDISGQYLLNTVKDMLGKVLPANLESTVEIIIVDYDYYNGNFTHDELRDFTYEEMRYGV